MSRKNGPESSQDKAKTCARWIRSLGVMAKDGDTTDLTLLNDLHDVVGRARVLVRGDRSGARDLEAGGREAVLRARGGEQRGVMRERHIEHEGTSRSGALSSGPAANHTGGISTVLFTACGWIRRLVFGRRPSWWSAEVDRPADRQHWWGSE